MHSRLPDATAAAPGAENEQHDALPYSTCGQDRSPNYSKNTVDHLESTCTILSHVKCAGALDMKQKLGSTCHL